MREKKREGSGVALAPAVGNLRGFVGQDDSTGTYGQVRAPRTAVGSRGFGGRLALEYPWQSAGGSHGDAVGIGGGSRGDSGGVDARVRLGSRRLRDERHRLTMVRE